MCYVRKRGDYQNCSVLYDSCAQWQAYAHTWAILKVDCWFRFRFYLDVNFVFFLLFCSIVVRPHRSTMYVGMRPVITDGVAWSVCRSVCRSVCHNHEPCKSRWTDRHVVWVVDSGEPREACVRWGCTLAQPGKYDWTVHVRRQCGPFVRLL